MRLSRHVERMGVMRNADTVRSVRNLCEGGIRNETS